MPLTWSFTGLQAEPPAVLGRKATHPGSMHNLWTNVWTGPWGRATEETRDPTPPGSRPAACTRAPPDSPADDVNWSGDPHVKTA